MGAIGGFAPHRDYSRLEPIFGSVAAAADAQFQFGFQGKPLLIGDTSDVDDGLDRLSYEITVGADEVSEFSE